MGKDGIALALISMVAGAGLTLGILGLTHEGEPPPSLEINAEHFRTQVQAQQRLETIEAEELLDEGRLYMRLAEFDTARARLREAFLKGAETTRRDALITLITMETLPDGDPEHGEILVESNTDLLGLAKDKVMASVLFAKAGRQFDSRDYAGASKTWEKARLNLDIATDANAAYNIVLCYLNMDELGPAQDALAQLKEKYPNHEGISRLQQLIDEKTNK